MWPAKLKKQSGAYVIGKVKARNVTLNLKALDIGTCGTMETLKSMLLMGFAAKSLMAARALPFLPQKCISSSYVPQNNNNKSVC